jgi:hypothetical protein
MYFCIALHIGFFWYENEVFLIGFLMVSFAVVLVFPTRVIEWVGLVEKLEDEDAETEDIHFMIEINIIM